MSEIDQAIQKIKTAYEKLGTSEMERLSGVNYTTIRALADKQFCPKTVDILKKLERASKLNPAKQ